MRIYLAGPMRGYDEFNFPAFNHWAGCLRDQGHEVLNPAETDHNNGFETAGLKGTDGELGASGFNLRAALAFDLSWICEHADAVAVLDGWAKSRGARAEVAAAQALSLPVYPVRSLYAWTPDGAEQVGYAAV
jgi:hypothetical protein